MARAVLKPTKKRVRRLAFIKYLYEQGLNNASRSFPFSAVSILNFHDAIELFLGLIAEETDAKHTDSILVYYDNISKSGKGLKIKEKNKVKALVKLRNNLKHGGVIPTQGQLEEGIDSAKTFFSSNVKGIFNIELGDISILDLVEDKLLRKHLELSKEQFLSGDLIGAFKELAHGFWELADKFERAHSSKGYSQFYFGKDMTFLNSFHLRIGKNRIGRSYLGGDNLSGVSESIVKRVEDVENQLDDLGEFIDAVQESTQRMQEALKIISLGLNYPKYTFFHSLTPSVRRTLGGKYNFTYGMGFDALEISRDDYDLCVEFVIESYFSLQDNFFNLRNV